MAKGGGGGGRGGGGVSWTRDEAGHLVGEKAMFLNPQDSGSSAITEVQTKIAKQLGGEQEGMYAVIRSGGAIAGSQKAYFKTEGAAKKYATKIIGKNFEKFGKSWVKAESYIREKGKLMSSKYPGKDIYGNKFSAGDAIYYSRWGVIKG